MESTPALRLTSRWEQFTERKADNIFAAFNKSMPSTMKRYSTSKLIEIFAVREIAKRGISSLP
jgi:hypothetical protein